jgi:hypothetical protein
MKEKNTLKKVLFVVFFIIFIAIISNNESYADVPEGDLKINLYITNGQSEYLSAMDKINYLECEIKNNGSIPNYDGDFATRNSVVVEEGGIIKIPKNKIVPQGTSGHYSVTLDGMPNGDYTISNMSVPMTEGWMDYYQMRYLSGDSTFTVNNDVAEIQANFLETYCNNYYYYYVDHSGHNPSVTFQLGSPIGQNYKFHYSKDENGNNVYVYDLDGETSDIVVKSKERTIVKDLPTVSNWPFRFISNINYGGRILSYSKGVTASTGSSLNVFASNIDSDGIGMVKAHYLEYFEIKKVAKISKKDILGNTVNAKFKLYDTVFSKYRGFDHYDTYEYNGETYSNVYVLNEDLSDEGEEISTQDGEAIIIYPNCEFLPDEDRHTGYYNGTEFKVIETSADDGLFYRPTETVGVIYGYDSDSKSLSLYDGGDLRTALDANPAEFDYDKITTNWASVIGETSVVNISNNIKPSVEKVALKPDGTVDTTCEDEFEFALYDYKFTLIDKIKVKANEKKYFNVEDFDVDGKERYYANYRYNYYIAEIKRDDYTFESITSTPMQNGTNVGEVYTFTDEELENIEENVYETCYKYKAVYPTYEEVTFTDKMVGTSISGEKTWVDNNNEAEKRPSNIKVQLKLKDEIVNTIIVEPDSDGLWKYIFSNIPKYKNGEEAEYTIDEEEVDLYEAEIEGYNIINILSSKDIKVTKEWNDENNKANARPSYLKVQLYSNGEKTGDPVIINDENNWTYTWKYLRKRMNNTEIKYTVEEVDVPENYEVEVTGNEEDGFVIKNTYVAPEEKTEEEEPKEEEPEEEPTAEEPKEEELEEEPTEDEPKLKPTKEETSVESVQTGDNIIVYIIIGFAACVIYVVLKKHEK